MKLEADVDKATSEKSGAEEAAEKLRHEQNIAEHRRLQKQGSKTDDHMSAEMIHRRHEIHDEHVAKHEAAEKRRHEENVQVRRHAIAPHPALLAAHRPPKAVFAAKPPPSAAVSCPSPPGC